MRAYDVRPTNNSAYDIAPNSPRRGARDVAPEGNNAVDVTPTSRGAFTGAPKSPEGSGSGFNGLFRTEDYVTPVPTGNSVGSAVAFGGAAALSITDASQTGLDLGGTFTLEGWTIGSVDNTNNKRFCLISKLSATDGGYELNWFRNGGGVLTLEFVVRQDNSTVGTHAPLWTAIQYNQTLFHHFAVVFEGGTTNMYIDGVGPLSTGTLSATSAGANSVDFNLAQNSSSSNKFIGTLSNIRVWTSARTQAQLIADMRNDNPSNTSSLKGYWKLNGDSNDSSGNGNNLTATGTPTYSTTLPFQTFGSTTRFYSGTQDGFVETQGSATFAAARNATTGNLANSAGTGGTVKDERIFGPLFYISRVGLSFPTNTLNAGNVVVGAHVYVFPSSGTSTVNSPSLDVVQFTPNAGTGIQLADFGNFSGTGGAFARKSMSTGGIYGYVEIGTAYTGWISTSGTTNLGLRTGNDMDNTAPGVTTNNQYIIHTNEQTGTTTAPFLDVVTVPR